LRSALGGRTERLLILVLTNPGDVTVKNITISAAVGRSPQGGEPLHAPDVEPLAPRETRPYRVSVEVAAPAFGSYAVFGSVYSDAAPVSFAVTTTTSPWLLYGLLALLLGDLLWVVSLRARRRRPDVAR